MNLNQKQIQSLDQSILVSDEMTVPSYQFSDACFSIDIQASSEAANNHNQMQILDSKKNIQALQVAKRFSFDLENTNDKEGQNVMISTGISSLVWMELDNKKHKWNAADDTTQFKGQTTNTETVRLRRSFLSKFLICF
ncbi:uncharacterized protein Fot_35451 [Forsythia ovata]|uniref:Uncharacterized protein n=1 Tax=Forsythia ovata TaxID=205694 RepID=A0ABD1SLJ6_9LAMI